MLDKKERNMLFPDHSVNFSSAGLGASHLQNTDFTPSSYFFNMNILEEASTKRKFLNLDGKNHPGVSSLLTGNNQFYDKDDFSIGQQAEYDKINKVLFSNQRQPYFQQKESSFLPEIYKEEVSRLRDIDHIGSFRQSEPSGFRSECGRDLLETFLHAQDKQQHGMVIPRLPLVLESSSYAEASLGKEKLKNTENIYLGKQDETAVEPNNRSLVERNSYANASLSSERLVGIGDVFSSNVDEQNKTTSRRVSPVISEKIWDGSLKLNTSTTVSAVAFFKRLNELSQDILVKDAINQNYFLYKDHKLQFLHKFLQGAILTSHFNEANQYMRKTVHSEGWVIAQEKSQSPASFIVFSGEKVQDLNWPAHIEIKGKVRLQAFEKFIQELPRSRNRALMVISLCWKVGSCRTDLAGMMEIAKGYRETEKVGFAQIPPGIDIYVCPRSDIIITILAKYGFFKGMAAVEEDQDSLIGCVVWRRGQSSTAKDTLGKKTLIEEQPLNSTGFSIQGMNSPAMEARECEKKQDMPSEIELKAGSEAATSPSVTDARSIIIDNKASLSSSNSNSSGFHCSAVQTISEKPSLNFLQENMKPADIIPLAQNSGADEAVLVSASSTQFVSPSKTDPVFMLRSSFSGSVSQSLGNFGSGPGPGPRPLIPVDSSNFQFQPQLAEKANNSSATINDSNCAGMNLAPSLQVTQPSLPGPPPFPLELLHRLIQSKENAPKAIINGGMLQDEIHIMHQIQATRDSSGGGRKEEEDDDLPEFDFNSACGEPEAPISRFHGFPNATPLNEKPSFAAPWIAGDPTPLASRTTKSFEALQHRQKPPTLPNNLSNSNEGLSLVAENYAKKTPSTEGCYQLTIQPSCFKETKDLGNNPSHGFAFERKSLWDDDDDMPEWCPPDLELPKQPLSGPDTTAPLSFHPCESHELPQRSKPGLLGPCPTTEAPKGGTARTRPTGEFAQISDLSKPPLGSRRRDPFRTHAGKFNRRPGPYDGRRHQS